MANEYDPTAQEVTPLSEIESTPDFQVLTSEDQSEFRGDYVAQYGNDEQVSFFNETISQDEEFLALPLEEQESFRDEYYQAYSIELSPERTIVGTIKDIGVGVGQGVVGLGSAVVGLADIVTPGDLQGWMKETVGYDPKETNEFLDTFLSPAQNKANTNVEMAKGFTEKFKSYIENPSAIVYEGVKTLPLMGGGGGIARIAQKIIPKIGPLVGAAFGEGAIQAGSMQAELTEEIGRETTLTEKGMALASGAGTGVFNLFGGFMSRKLGIADIDTWLAGGATKAAKEGKKGVARSVAEVSGRLVGGGISEGIFEEAPQSAQETMWMNAAMGKPIMDGVPESVASGIVLGGAMGGGFNVLAGGGKPISQIADEAANVDISDVDKSMADIDTILSDQEQDFIDSPATVDVAIGQGVADIEAEVEAEMPVAEGGFREGKEIEVEGVAEEVDPIDDIYRRRDEVQARIDAYNIEQPERAAEFKRGEIPFSEMTAVESKLLRDGRASEKEMRDLEEEISPEKVEVVAEKEPIKPELKPIKEKKAIVEEEKPTIAKEKVEVPAVDEMTEAISQGGINLDSAKQIFSPTTIAELGKKRPGLFRKKGGENIDEMAQSLGYETANDLQDSWSAAPTKKQAQADLDREARAQFDIAEDKARISEQKEAEKLFGEFREEILKDPIAVPVEEINDAPFSDSQKEELIKLRDLPKVKKVGEKKEDTKVPFDEEPGREVTPPTGEGVTETVDNEDSIVAGHDINAEPSEDQKSAGNYKKPKKTVEGLDLTFENPAGSTRSGTDRSGKKWEITMVDDYGYVRGSTGFDKDHVDIFVKKGYQEGDSDVVHVVNQFNKDGSFDEHKVVLGARGKVDAKRTYNRNYEKGWTGGKSVVEMPIDEFKEWVFSDAPSKGELKGEKSVSEMSIDEFKELIYADVPEPAVTKPTNDYGYQKLSTKDNQKIENEFRTKVNDVLKNTQDSDNVMSILDARAGSLGMTAGEYLNMRGVSLIPDSKAFDIETRQRALAVVEIFDDSLAIIHVFERADVSTIHHELFHIFRRDLQGQDLRVAERYAGVKDGNWTVANEEKITDAYEKYLRIGKAPTTRLKRVFDKISATMRLIYETVRGSAIDVEITPEITALFDKMLTPGVSDKFVRGKGGDILKTKQKELFPKKQLPLFQSEPDYGPKESKLGLGTFSKPDIITRAQSKADHWQDFIYNWTDIHDPRKRVMATTGKKHDAKTDILTVERLRGKKTADATERFMEDKVEKQFLKPLVKNKIDISNFEEFKYVMHVPERNEQMQRVNSKRYLNALLGQMTDKQRAPWIETIKQAQLDNEANNGTMADLHDEYLDIMGMVFGDIDTMQRELDNDQQELDNRVWTNAEVAKGTPERKQKTLDKRGERLGMMDEIKNTWEERSPRFAGITDQEAQTISDKYANDPKIAIYEKLGKRLDEINRSRLDILYGSGELSKEEYDGLITLYKHYVPLHRDGFEDTGGGPTGRVTGPTGKPLKVAKGSMLEVVDIFANTVMNHQTAINRAHKSEAGRVLFNFAKENPDAGISVEEQEKKPMHDREGNIVMYPDPVEPDNGIFIKVDGKRYLLKFAIDSKTEKGRTLKRFLDSIKTSDVPLLPAFKLAMKVNQFLAKINTMFSPEFMMSNFARDIQTAGIHIEDTAAKGMQLKIGKDVGAAIRGIWRAERGKTPNDMSKLYREFSKEGGKIGWLQGYENVDDLANELKSSMKKHEKGHVVRKSLTATVNLVKHANTAIENGVRLATYKALVESGETKSQAALAASNLTVDFTRHGKYGPVLNSLYMFANAGIQGNVRMIKAAKRSAKVRAMLGGIMTAGFAMNMLAIFSGGEDDMGELYIDGIPDFVKERNMIVMRPGTEGDYIPIPMPYGYSAVYNFGFEIAKAVHSTMTGESYNPMQGAMRVVTGALKSFNPLASSTLLQTVSPTVLDPLAMVAENKTAFGRELMPAQTPYGPPRPESERYWKSAREPSKFIAKQLNKITGGDKYEPGAIDVSPETFDMVYETITGSAGKFVANVFGTADFAARKYLGGDEGVTREIKDIPFVRRIYGKQSPYIAGTRYREKKQELEIFKRRYEAAEGSAKRDLYLDSRRKDLSVLKRYDKRIRDMNKKVDRLEAKGNEKAAEIMKERIMQERKDFLLEVK